MADESFIQGRVGVYTGLAGIRDTNPGTRMTIKVPASAMPRMVATFGEFLRFTTEIQKTSGAWHVVLTPCDGRSAGSARFAFRKNMLEGMIFSRLCPAMADIAKRGVVHKQFLLRDGKLSFDLDHEPESPVREVRPRRFLNKRGSKA